MALSTDPYALVVDDDVMTRIDATQILQDAGFRTYDACDGDEAKMILAEFHDRIILLFSDVEMPGEMNGFALARFTSDHWPDISIVVASGGTKPVSGDMPERATFISKPFDDQIVHDHLRKTLADGRQPELLRHAV